MIKFEYTEIGGLLYPNIENDGKAELENLGKYGRLHLSYLHEQRPQTYQELLLTGKLAEHCAKIDMTAFEMVEHIRADYLRAHSMLEDDVLERIGISTQAQMIVVDQLVCS